MPDLEKFDQAVELAWREFRGTLADHIGTMRGEDILVVELAEEPGVGGYLPCVQFLAWAEDLVRCEVPSNAFLDPRFALSPADEALLIELGWQHPTCAPDADPGDGSPAHFLDRTVRWSDQLASMAVSAFRDVWSVPHPSFLRAEAIGSRGANLAGPTVRDWLASDVDPMLAVAPRDPDHLRDLVEAALTDLLGDQPQVDSDGDFVLTLEGHAVFVIPHATEPVVRLWVPLLYRIGGRTRAAETVADLTARWSHLRFVLREDRLNAVIEVPGFPFVPRHLTDLLDRITAFLATVDRAFAARFDAVGYRTTPSPATDHECVPDVPPSLMAVMQLVLFGEGDLDAEMAADVCERDRTTILEYMRISAERDAEWRGSLEKARAEADPDEIALCEGEAAAWSDTLAALSGALRVVSFSRPGLTPAPPVEPPRQMELFEDPAELTLFDDPPELASESGTA
ncbi:T3SS (YopN, CesT) and YbjN peptide-binding chaperone 1 [Rhodococcus maanshanensis]|uniref:YbjN domain-containing protein n=1 Tax=Rhodococcus maanshanensis TaxID=183556 RepID=A0A1H7PMX3_9NOCA|nr:hypothetical protein [Rhodococcus maanshanensis]SEL36936.1 hypothetical protein SAMN05444583_108101 [Rhodococcus maanshanensis]